MSSGSERVRAWRRGFAVSAALFLATAALAGLSIQSVYREAQVRRRLIADTHRSIANIVSVRLDAAMAEADRSVASQLQAIELRAETMLSKLNEIETSQPWLQPLILASEPPDRIDSRVFRTDRSGETFAAAEHAEYRAQSPREAARLYAQAASKATSAGQRAAALNGQARTELKASDPLRATRTYKKLIAETETLDSDQARLSLIARDQLVLCARLLGSDHDVILAALDLYEFLIGHRFILDPDTYDFYKRQALEALAGVPGDLLEQLRVRDQQIDSIAASLRAALAEPNGANDVVTMTRIGSTGAQVAHVWTLSSARALLARLLAEPGPWSAVGVALAEDGVAGAVGATLPLARAPHWRVVASPASGSVDTLASHEVTRFAALLVLLFGTVVIAMILAARSVARELALSQTRSDFVASVSHELKTPLSLIRMFAESLREGWVSEDKRTNYYEVITRESERLTVLINNVLDFSRIESGTRKYQRGPADLRKILADLLDRYQYHLKAANIDLIKELPAEPVYAFVDSEAIEQVLLNLLSNAVKYMGDADGRPRNVRVSLIGSAEKVVIRIADTGIGMSEEQRAHIFERFWRAGDERVRAVAGSGLGLTLVKHIVEAHAGTIAVESVVGQGSTFAVTLPAIAGVRS